MTDVFEKGGMGCQQRSRKHTKCIAEQLKELEERAVAAMAREIARGQAAVSFHQEQIACTSRGGAAQDQLGYLEPSTYEPKGRSEVIRPGLA